MKDTLDRLRDEIRAGRLEAAEALWNALPADTAATPSFRIERGFIDVLTFRPVSEIEERLGDAAGAALDPLASIRKSLLQAILANRSRDPLSALACLQSAHSVARATGAVTDEIDTLLEFARVNSWMGRAERTSEYLLDALVTCREKTHSKTHEFLVLARLADHYAEAQRWQTAARYARLSDRHCGSIGASIFVWQLRDCQARINVQLGNLDAASQALSCLWSVHDKLPGYLKFRYGVAMVEEALQHSDAIRARKQLAELEKLADGQSANSYERMVVAGLAGRIALFDGDHAEAEQQLATAVEWNRLAGLSVPYVNYAILQSEALEKQSKHLESARLLTEAREHCARNNLHIQKETIDVSMAQRGIPLVAEFETGRSVQSRDWKDRSAYIVLKTLGAGGQGTVYQCFDNNREKMVALKQIKLARKESSSSGVEMLRREIEALSAAQVLGVARIIACGPADDGDPYMVQEYVAGQSLRALMTNTGATPTQLIVHLAKVAAILERLHEKGIVHGDIKPENIVVAADGSPRLVDFGVANIMGRNGGAAKAGTIAYLPPIAALKMHKAHWRDTYAMGIMLIECLSGARPELADRWKVSHALWLDPHLRNSVNTFQLRDDRKKEEAQRLALKLISPLSRSFGCGAIGLEKSLTALVAAEP